MENICSITNSEIVCNGLPAGGIQIKNTLFIAFSEDADRFVGDIRDIEAHQFRDPHAAAEQQQEHAEIALRIRPMDGVQEFFGVGFRQIDRQALAQALNTGKLAGAGVDVLSTEPPAADNPLLSCEKCMITPHIAWAGFETRKRLIEILTDNIRGFVSGAPRNVVN